MGAALLVLAAVVGILLMLGRGGDNGEPVVAVEPSPVPTASAPAGSQLAPPAEPSPTAASTVLRTEAPAAAPPTSEPTMPAPTPTPVPLQAAFTVMSDTLNVRRGPGTNYAVIGRLTAGQSYEITGKNPVGDWLQFDLNGQQGWVIANLVSVSGDSNTVQVAENIPAPPPPPTARPIADLRFVQLSLLPVANANLKEGYANPPTGQVTLGGVPFDLKSGETATTQAEPLPNNPTRVWLPASTTNVSAVYLLLTGGDLYLDYDRRPIGKVRLIFADNRDYAVDLIGGVNVREWKQGGGVIASTTSPDVTEVWRSSDRYDGSPAVIDLLRIAVPADLQGRKLEGIEVLDTSTATVGTLDPAINLLGVTLAAEAPPSPAAACAVSTDAGLQAVWQGADVRARAGCATANATTTDAAYGQFERGAMIWRRDLRIIYVMSSDGAWRSYQDTWTEAEGQFYCPESAPSESPPSPQRGFSKVWCQNPDVRQQLGNILQPEWAEVMLTQSFAGATMVKSSQGMIVLFADGSWLRR